MPCIHVRYSVFFSIPVCRYPMIGLQVITVSPSSSSRSRSTPCVEGCCGPMLMIMVSCRISPEESRSGASVGVPCIGLGRRALIDGRDEGAVVPRVHTAELLVLPQREALPIVGEEDAGEVRVA